MYVERDEFVDLIPHAGRMCLVDRVDGWNADSLRASAATHRRPDHPLLRGGRLGAVHALEYAAQAMAIHGALLARRNGSRLPPGFLAGARNLRLHVPRLDELTDDLHIEVDRRFEQDGNLIYAFRVSSGGQAVADGTATVAVR